MSATYKVLAQSNPLAATLTTLYTAPASAVVSTLSVCNQGATTTFRVLVSVAGESIDSKQYIIYDTGIDAKDSVFLTLGLTLAATDQVKVYANTANVSFNMFGSEV